MGLFDKKYCDVCGEYIDYVTETVRKILNGEAVEDYVAPATPEEAPGAE